MGFNLYGLGNIKPCHIENGTLIYRLPYSGKELSYKTTMSISIPEQTNLFLSKTVMFYLEDADKCYVGRTDGRISIYRKSDKMLVGLQLWEVPPYPRLCECGFYLTPKGNVPVKLDTRDHYTLYVDYKRMEAKLHEPMYNYYMSDLAVSKTFEEKSDTDWYIVDKEGVYAEVDAWSVQDDLWKPDCRKFL